MLRSLCHVNEAWKRVWMTNGNTELSVLTTRPFQLIEDGCMHIAFYIINEQDWQL